MGGPDARLLTRTKWIAHGAGALALVLGGAGLAGWIFDSQLLKTGLTGNISMKANTAFAICLSATALLCLLPRSRSVRRVRIAQAASLLVLLIGLVTFSQHVFGWNAGIDELLFS